MSVDLSPKRNPEKCGRPVKSTIKITCRIFRNSSAEKEKKNLIRARFWSDFGFGVYVKALIGFKASVLVYM